MVHDAGSQGVASTGPRSFERGGHGEDFAGDHLLDWLQRGRALSSAEASSSIDMRRRRGLLQRGRALSSAEARARKRRTAWPYMLQRGRALSSAEATPFAYAIPPYSGFNGAALFRARRPLKVKPRSKTYYGLQRGRALSSAEAQSQVASSCESHLLQRGRALSSAEAGAGASGPWSRPQASTGPRSFERGGIQLGEEQVEAAKLQRGRALSSAEAVWAEAWRPPLNMLQRGRALSSAEAKRRSRLSLA